MITKYEYIPLHFRRGIIVAIPKGTKNALLQDNYRGLTLLPVISKMYEKCVCVRLEKHSKFNKLISKYQGAGQDKCSNIHTAWIIKETVAANTKNGGVFYVGTLDARKAYDTVFQNGLFYQLYNLGINGKVWRILRKMYKGFTCQVRVAGMLSEPFLALQGIHQGAPCSMLMYEFFNNDLLAQLQQSIPQVKLSNMVVNGVAYADDVTLLAKSRASLQSLFDIADKFNKKWQFEYNPDKCRVLVYGKERQNVQQIVLGRYVLTETKHEPHLGVVLATTPNQEEIYLQDRIVKCKCMGYAVQSIGSNRVPVNPVIAKKLYESAIIPKLCYGVEILEVTNVSTEDLEQYQSQNAKLMQALPSQAANIGSCVTVGLMSIRARIDMMRLLFLWRLLLLSVECMYKVLTLRRIVEVIDGHNLSGPVYKMIMTSEKYGLLQEIMDSVESGNYCSMTEWKRKVKQLVKCADNKNIKVSCKLYKSLVHLRIPDNMMMLGWWIFGYACPKATHYIRIVCKLLLNTPRLGEGRCTLCESGVSNNISHILFECQCEAVKEVREQRWIDVYENGPAQMIVELEHVFCR